MGSPLLRLCLVSLGIAPAVLASCTTTTILIYRCSEDAHCTEQGAGGVCEPADPTGNRYCSFPSEDCASGRRWHALADRDYANQCVGGETAASGTDSTASEGTETTATPGDSTTSGGPSSTTDPGSTDDGEVSTTTVEPGDTSTGPAAASCTDTFGTIEGFILCEETETSCRFSALLNGTSCTDACTGAGATCIEAVHNASNSCEVSDAGATCDEVVNDQICVCSRPA